MFSKTIYHALTYSIDITQVVSAALFALKGKIMLLV